MPTIPILLTNAAVSRPLQPVRLACRYLNNGSKRCLLYSMQFKFDITSMKEMVQPIGTGYGFSMQVAILRELDLWLMNGEHLLNWEGKMTVMKRRILVTHLVA